MKIDIVVLLLIGAFDWVFALLSPLLILLIYVVAMILMYLVIGSQGGLMKRAANSFWSRLTNIASSLKAKLKKTQNKKPQENGQVDTANQGNLSKKVKFSQNLEQVRNIDDVDKSFKERMQG